MQEPSYQNQILVRSIDGRATWVLVSAREIADEVYEILDDPEYHGEDNSVLFEFYPGDIVHGDFVTLPMEDHYQAVKLIRAGTWPRREYYIFQFMILTDSLAVSEHNLDQWAQTISLIRQEMSTGKFFYRRIRETIHWLDKQDNR